MSKNWYDLQVALTYCNWYKMNYGKDVCKQYDKEYCIHSPKYKGETK